MSMITADLAASLRTVRRPGDFFAAGTVALLAPSLEVEGVGPVALPLLPTQARQLVAAAEPAPYGRGAETVVDPAVRRCWQIGPDRARLRGRHWARTLETVLDRVAEGLGVDAPVTAEFHKLLLYDEGAFFVGHRDTEKAPGMFATLVVSLPSFFKGGELVVRHKGREARLDLRPDDPAEAAFGAFYADCVHEVLPVTEGCRLALVYNLVRRGGGGGGRGGTPEPPDYTRERTRIAALLADWRDAKGRADDTTPEKLVHPLEHAYTPAELGFAALKGADAAAAAVLEAAARQARCDLHLALLTVEDTGPAEYADSYGGGWGAEEDSFEAGEEFDRYMTLSDWRRPDGGESATLGDIPAAAEEFSPPDACDELEPGEEHFHEATGNEGASFERTYRRAALVLWPSDRTFAVLSQAGLPVTLPFLEDLARRWTENGGHGDSPLLREAQDLAGHMIAQWPRNGWYPRADRAPSDATRMLTVLTALRDTALIERFLAEVAAAGGCEQADNPAMVAALDLLPTPRAAVLIERIVAGTATAAFGSCADLLARAAAAGWGQARAAAGGHLVGAAAALAEALPGGDAATLRAEPHEPWRRGSKVDARAVVDLLSGLDAIDATLAERSAERILARPKTYGADAVLLPALRALVGAGTTRSSAATGRLRAACVAHLRARIAEPLAPPADWRRADALPCRCRHCAELARFLADPEQRSWLFKAVEADRSHVEDSIRRAGSDLDTTTDRRGRPYTLVCAKNQASFERRAKQRAQDLKDLALLTG
jgi:predicted 2-oxoglutarate/Fe(II)-dependent dioxygenase YbiX